MRSAEITALFVIAFAAFVYFLISEIRRRRRTARLVSWVKENHPEEWNSLPWISRKINSLSGLALLYKRCTISDGHFTAEFMAIRPFQNNQNIAFIIAVGALLLVNVAIAFGYWHW